MANLHTQGVVELSIFALILLVGGCIAAGVCAAVIHTWSLRASLYDLQSRLEVVEGNLLREVKARAGQERWKKPEKDKELMAELVNAKSSPQKRLNWWETNLPRSAP